MGLERWLLKLASEDEIFVVEFSSGNEMSFASEEEFLCSSAGGNEPKPLKLATEVGFLFLCSSARNEPIPLKLATNVGFLCSSVKEAEGEVVWNKGEFVVNMGEMLLPWCRGILGKSSR